MTALLLLVSMMSITLYCSSTIHEKFLEATLAYLMGWGLGMKWPAVPSSFSSFLLLPSFLLLLEMPPPNGYGRVMSGGGRNEERTERNKREREKEGAKKERKKESLLRIRTVHRTAGCVVASGGKRKEGF